MSSSEKSVDQDAYNRAMDQYLSSEHELRGLSQRCHELRTIKRKAESTLINMLQQMERDHIVIRPSSKEEEERIGSAGCIRFQQQSVKASLSNNSIAQIAYGFFEELYGSSITTNELKTMTKLFLEYMNGQRNNLKRTKRFLHRVDVDEYVNKIEKRTLAKQMRQTEGPKKRKPSQNTFYKEISTIEANDDTMRELRTRIH
jgi:DNA repair ATPase RecN